MNLDICKKCNEGCIICFKNKKNDHFILSQFFIPYSSEFMLVSEKIFYHDNKNWFCIKDKDKIKNNDYYIPEENDFNIVELNKSCPYYMEHLMSEWNKK